MSAKMESAVLDKMNFSQLLSHNVGMALKLEILWFHQPRHGPKHLMPFLSRNLLYVRRARGAKRVKKKKEENGADEPNVKKLNLLLDIFRHRTVMYNDALLDSPRRTTRRLVEAEVSSVTPVKIAAQGKKRKRDDDDDDDDDSSSADSRQGFEQQHVNRTWKEKLAVNDKGRDSRNESNVQSQKRNTNSVSPISPLSTSDDGLASGMMPLAGNEDGLYLSSTARAATSMFIHYLVLGENGVPAVYVEEREDRRCPFCFHDAVSDTGMVAHLSASHGDNLVFKSARSEVGALHVVATFDPRSPVEGKEHLKDFVFVSTLSESLSPVPFVQRSAQNVAALDVTMRKKHIRLLQEMGADEQHVKSFVPDDNVPIRQYFHSKTYQPMVGGDWDVDSDEDSTTDEWLQETTTALLDDFTDLDADEKKFMKLWNQFIKSYTVIADRSMPERCMAFIRTYAVKLKANELRQELSLHMHNLWDHGIVSSDHVVECMAEYDSTGEWV